MKIELIAKPSYEQVAAFNNMKDAVAAQDDYIYSGKGDAYLSFT